MSMIANVATRARNIGFARTFDMAELQPGHVHPKAEAEVSVFRSSSCKYISRAAQLES